MLCKRMIARTVVNRAVARLACVLALAALALTTGCPENPQGPPVLSTIIVRPSPAGLDAPWVLYSGWGDYAIVYQTGQGEGYVVDCSPGRYSVEWLPILGYLSPIPNLLEGTAEAGFIKVFEGTYTPEPGRVTVDPEPDGIEPTWVLSGPGGFEQTGAGAVTFYDREHGEYAVDWGDLDGYVTPSPDPASGTLEPGGHLLLWGTYVPE